MVLPLIESVFLYHPRKEDLGCSYFSPRSDGPVLDFPYVLKLKFLIFMVIDVVFLFRSDNFKLIGLLKGGILSKIKMGM